MLGKCVHSVSGIENKQLVKVDHHNGFDFYMLRTDYEKNDGFQRIYFEHDGYFFPIASGIERIKRYLDQNPSFNLLEWITADFEESLKTGERINKGYAQFLGREEEAKKAVEAYKERKRIEQEKQEEERRKQELEKQKEEEKRLAQSENEFIEGEKITGEDFLKLCEKYNISLPVRTKGWAKENLISISKTSYRFYGNESKTILDYAEKLYKTINIQKECMYQVQP